jgi:hypothetical protein
MKPTKRKAFNFLRSYFDVLNKIDKDEDKLYFLLSIINKQFLDEDPKDLDFLVDLCYLSQKHAIESSVKGWKRANNTDLTGNPLTDPTTNPPTNPTTTPKEEEEEEEEKEKGEGEGKRKKNVFNFRKSLIGLGANEKLAAEWLNVRKNKKATNSETALNNFKNQVKKSKYNINEILEVCVVKSWGSFKSSWDLDGSIDVEAIENPSNEELITFNSNVNPTVFKLPRSQFLKLQEDNKSGGYKYKILA